MAQTHYKTLLRKGLFGFITEQDPVLAMLEWVAQMTLIQEAFINGVSMRRIKH